MRVLIASVLALAAGLLIGALLFAGTTAAGPAASPQSPGGARVVRNGAWTYYEEIVTGSGSFELSGAYTMQKTELGVLIRFNWPGATGHTWADLTINRVESSTARSGR